MLAEPVDAPFFAQATKEVVVRFVELGLIIALGVGVDETFVERKTVFAEQTIENLDDSFILVDTAVAIECRQIQPGAQREAIVHEAARFAEELCIGNQPGDFARAGSGIDDTATRHA